MWGILIAFPVLIGLAMLQTVVVSSLHLLHGTGDIILLTIVAWSIQNRVRSAWEWAAIAGLIVGVISALPVYVPLAVYLAVVAVTRLLIKQIWHSPILTMVVMTIVATLISQGITYGALLFTGLDLPLMQSINLVIIPSVLLNLMFAVPVYVAFVDLARWIYPGEVEA